MKLWAVHIRSESGDHYYLTFKSIAKPGYKKILAWLDSNDFCESSEYLSVQEVFEVKEDSPIL